jgi:exodeoxyribonuclease VII small subunit
MAKKRSGSAAGADGPSFEEALEQLESIIDQIESGEIGLEQSIEAYEKGVELIKRCRGVLERAEQRIEELNLSDLRERQGSSGTNEEDDDGDETEESPF